ncbi:hypothetical protein [Reyranella sp.]|uniref:hypothetical protein n=1 Tax=Reyranella sp. TaxID=1929291 RepID=UPI00272666A9|nr:hypothetical protein [Reyranella sp.]MDO8976749.1 hypothetical protein [Reyranella sp.]
MTRLWHRRMTRLHNRLPIPLSLIAIAAATIAGALVVIDRFASLGAHAARALL